MAAPANCTAVTAPGSLPRSNRAWATMSAAESRTDNRTRPSPAGVVPREPAPLLVTSPTPASDTAKPAHASGRAKARCHSAAKIATSTGTAPTRSAAWLTLVRSMPAFCRSTDPPYPTAPDMSTLGRIAAPSPARLAGRSRSAATPKRAKVSHAGGSQYSATFDSGTVVPQKNPAAISAATAWPRRRSSSLSTRSCSGQLAENFLGRHDNKIIICYMAIELDDIDVRLLTALQEDADRTNVELARIAGLSPAATLHRVRWLKESGVIRIVSATLDPAAAGFPLQLHVTATLARHDPRSTKVFEDHVRSLPQIIAADNVAGEMDYLMTVVARNVTELQEVLASLSVRGGQRLVTHLKLAEVKPPSRLPLAARSQPGRRPSRRRRRSQPG
jgi:Lrp/AsnC family transcriptional regulator, leucine-responsive regulatory protein